MHNHFCYRVIDYKVIDGDTVDLTLDLGFHIHHKSRFRLYGINAPERKDRANWLAAKLFLVKILESNSPHITAMTIKDKKDKYGRYLVSLVTDTNLNLNVMMVSAGHAVPYYP